MRISDIGDLINETGLPVAYMAFQKADLPPLPRVTYQVEAYDFLRGENRNLEKSTTVVIDLFTKLKDEDTEALVENALSIFPCSKEEDYNSEELCFQISYRVTV